MYSGIAVLMWISCVYHVQLCIGLHVDCRLKNVDGAMHFIYSHKYNTNSTWVWVHHANHYTKKINLWLGVDFVLTLYLIKLMDISGDIDNDNEITLFRHMQSYLKIVS